VTAVDAVAVHPLHPLPPVGRTFVGGFESTHHPAAGVDALDVTGHAEHWHADLEHLLASGVRHLRLPLRWPRIETAPGVFDWSETDRVLGDLRDRGAVPIVDLVHHTSYPDWLTDGFRGPDFGPAFLRYAEAVALRYPWLPAYTLFNEPFATLFLAGHEALWPPYDRGLPGFRRLLLSVLPALSTAAGCWRELLPAAHHVWVDTAEHHTGTGPGVAHAEMANDRRHVVLDLALGHDLDPVRPFLGELLADGGEALLELRPLRVDLLGLDYYSHSEWSYDERGSHAPSPAPAGLAAVAEHYADRYGLPVWLSETNVRGLPSDRTSWLRYTLEQYELALSRGVPLHGYCWFPTVDSADWDSLLARAAGRVDPVGVVSLAPDGSRQHTSFTRVWEQAAAGAPVAALPAPRFQPPCDADLAGLLPSLTHWPWRDPEPQETVPARPVEVSTAAPFFPEHQEQPVTATVGAPIPDLVVLSHLRWSWVWQRPQHIVSRLARMRAADCARTWFVEEPVTGDVAEPELGSEEVDGLTRVWLVLPRSAAPDEKHLGFDDPAAAGYGDLVAEFLRAAGRPVGPDVWLYTPMALDVAQRLGAGRLVYDVMDDLASFQNAPTGLVLRQRRLLAEADVVFTGGPSLHRSVRPLRRDRVHLFRSGVETGHYAASRLLRRPHERPVAGYVGVLDERLDLRLVADLATELPDWIIRMVGPVAKIDPAQLPQGPNLEYPGLVAYADLPRVMAGFDVALMPFALNEATRSISPTKTLEYLAAGLPVVSTPVPDVVGDYTDVVHLADDGAAFAAACRAVLEDDVAARDRRVRPLQARQEWDAIAASMVRLIEASGAEADRVRAEEPA
jgi:glycosyltransferase involved in cell wall biosynthesis/beta-glucosidase/6-phospho-beta-glucosidase/beta-galactosidase